MNVARISIVQGCALALAVAAIALSPSAVAQAVASPANISTLNEAVAMPLWDFSSSSTSPSGMQSKLPDAPGYKAVPSPNTAPIHAKYIAAGETAQPITAHDKMVIGLKDLYSPENFASMFLTSGYEHVMNGEPNYGTDRGAFGQRLGAAAIRESTQGAFTDIVFAPLLREDPRYYVLGQGHSFVHRTLYAITRPLITRTDSGASTVNGALLLGYASSSALSYTYYPSSNQNFHDTASTFGGAVGGAALGFFVSEFSSDFLRTVHLKKQ